MIQAGHEPTTSDVFGHLLQLDCIALDVRGTTDALLLIDEENGGQRGLATRTLHGVLAEKAEALLREIAAACAAFRT